jgi:putative RNA 2'-phosphotransferase
MSLDKIGSFLCFALRHRPDQVGIELDEHGWANVDELISGVNRVHPEMNLDIDLLSEIVRIDNKTRYSFNEDKTLIRANQGHSVPVDVELAELVPPMLLYHGTAEKYVESIDATGLIPKSRLYVHLSADYDTAIKVGTRHGSPVIYTVDATKMHEDGYKLYRSVNGVWLTKEVPTRYLTKM